MALTPPHARVALSALRVVESGFDQLPPGRRGSERIWELQPKRLADTREYLDRISRESDDALSRLEAFVED